MAIPEQTFGPSLDDPSVYLDTSESQWLDATSGEVTFAGPRFTLAGVIDTEQQQDDTEIFDHVASPQSGVITGTQPVSLLSSSESVIEQFVDSPDQTSASITVDNSLLPADSPHPSEVNEDHMVLAEAEISAASVI